MGRYRRTGGRFLTADRGDANIDVATSSLTGTESAAGPLDGFMAGAAVKTDDKNLIVWLRQNTSPARIAAVAALLADSGAVDHFRYVDQAATYDDFTTFYADRPEIIDLVEPGMLPTSFVVETSTPDELAERLADLPGVSHIDLG